MKISTINNITESGFTKKQVEAIAQAFEEIEASYLTRDTLRAEIAESENRLKAFTVGVLVLVLSPIYAKLFGFI